ATVCSHPAGSRARLLGHGTPWWSSGVQPHVRSAAPSAALSSVTVSRKTAGATRAGTARKRRPAPVRIGGRDAAIELSSQGGGPDALHRQPRAEGCGTRWTVGFRGDVMPTGRPARRARALGQLRLIAADASSAELLAARALAVLDTAVPFDDGALFGVDESSLLFNRLLASRGQAPETMRAWLRDIYLVAGEPGALHVPTLLRERGGVATFHEDGDRW